MDPWTSLLLGVALGFLTSLVAWWLVARAIASKLELSQQISKVPDPLRSGSWKYRVKVVNLRRWFLPHAPAVEVRIAASLRVKGSGGYRYWTNFPIPIAHTGELDLIERNALPRLRLFDMQPEHLQRLVNLQATGQDVHDVELEHLLDSGIDSEVRVVVSAAHPYTGARRSVTRRYVREDIVPRPFSKSRGKAGLAIARLSPPLANASSNVDRPPGLQRVEPQEVERALLFQYGSNMSQQRLAKAVHRYVRFAPHGTPLDLRLVGAARLEGWKLVFDLFSVGQQSLVADIRETGKADEVWGSLYELSRELVIRSDGERSVLDRIEGRRTERDPENYTLIEVVVEIEGKRQSAFAYAGTDDARLRCRASHEHAEVDANYASSILAGAAAVGLPEQYFHRLEKQIAASGPKGLNE